MYKTPKNDNKNILSEDDEEKKDYGGESKLEEARERIVSYLFFKFFSALPQECITVPESTAQAIKTLTETLSFFLLEKLKWGVWVIMPYLWKVRGEPKILCLNKHMSQINPWTMHIQAWFKAAQGRRKEPNWPAHWKWDRT